MKHLAIVLLLLSVLALLVLSPAVPAAAQASTATPTVTYTPIATASHYTSNGYALPSGATLVVENRATMGETLLVIGMVGLTALGIARWVYDLAVEWGK